MYIPGVRRNAHDTGLETTLASFSPFERVVGTLLFMVFLVSGLTLLSKLNTQVLTEIPRDGGIYTEAIIGFPRFINPLLAVSAADRDLTALVYAGLMRVGSTGSLEPHLAQEFSISDDRRTYTFKLKKDATFHDGVPVTAEDVAFTIARAQNATLKSPRFAAWEGILVETPDQHTVTFTLDEPYATFLENTTLGILPKHIWEGATLDEFQFSEWNVTPVGAGPYRVERVTRDSGGIPNVYVLTAFEEYVLGTPHIRTLKIKLFRSETQVAEALKEGESLALGGIAPSDLTPYMSPSVELNEAPLLRLFSIYLNHNRLDMFLRREVREALDLSISREALVREVLLDHGAVATTPLPTASTPWRLTSSSTSDPTLTHAYRLEKAKQILEEEGWEKGEDGIFERITKDGTMRLAFSLATPNTPELATAAERVTATWRELGAEVELKIFEPADLTQDIIRPRKFDALLFGTVVGRGLDLYPFWHSSQRSDPGLNIAQYTNIEADKLLEQTREEVDEDVRATLYQELSTLIAKERPALFLYTPHYLYLVPTKVHNVSLPTLTDPSERFSNIHEWYIETDLVWPFIVPFTH